MHEILARVIRGDGPESFHFGAIAVVDISGNLTHFAGDPETFTFTRSSAKPFQLIPLLTSGAAAHFGFSRKQLAIMCGSHTGTLDHVATTRSNLALAGLSENDLKCGVHAPLYYRVEDRLPREGETFSPAQHNCSGKHSGFLALAKFLGDNPADYLERNSRAQQLVLHAVSDMYGVLPEDIKLGTDGCSAPNFGMPLIHTAQAFAKLATENHQDPSIRAVLKEIRAAMQEFPEMVSGPGRFDLAVAKTFPGNVVNKVGAEAIEGLGFSEPPLGIAVKILDGNQRALYPVVIETLRQLKLLDGADMSFLKTFDRPEVYNYRSIRTGEIVAEFTLKKADA
jgi:L-asparaginase II